MNILEKYNTIRSYTEQICEPLSTEDYIPQPAYFGSPPKWHLAHTTWFFEELILKKHYPNYIEFNEQFTYLFNSYYNSIGERTSRENRGDLARPFVKEVYAYRAYVNQFMNELISNEPSIEVTELITLGLNHEQQHQELLITDLKFTFSKNPLFPVYKEKSNLINNYNKSEGFVEIEEGVYQVGHEGDDFHYDNEVGKHKTYIQSFNISKALVTNGEFLEFMNSGGYSQYKHWLDEGWNWVNENNINSPLYWHKIDDEWFIYTLSGIKPLDKNAILVHISFYEANAYAMWKGMRLPTEFEWEVASEQLNLGERWEWTNSAYLPYPNFKTDEGAVGEYNGKFMVNQMVLRGGSVATAEGHSRPTYRNFFHPHYQWQFTGIRLVK